MGIGARFVVFPTACRPSTTGSAASLNGVPRVSVSGIAPWTRLLLISLALFVACKWLTYRRALRWLKGVSVPRRLGYWLLWPGMDAPAFLDPKRGRYAPSARDWLRAVVKTL